MAQCGELMKNLSIRGGDAAPVELGYVEEVESDELYRIRYHHYFFQGKVGGKPAWLSFSPLPRPREVECGVCGEPMSFLLQLYAPIQREDSFHRSLFLFLCPNPRCSIQDSSRNFAVFRCQLPRKNKFYRKEEPLDPDKDKEFPEGTVLPESVTQLCFVCGCAGPKRCSQCLKVTYCSKSHQALHWKLGHKSECSSTSEGPNLDLVKGVRFPEAELVTEPEGTIF